MTPTDPSPRADRSGRRVTLASPLARRMLLNFLMAAGVPIILMTGLTQFALGALDDRSLDAAHVSGVPVSRWLLSLGLSALLLAALLSLMQIRRILVPLARLHRGVRHIARGDAGARVKVQGHDEIADLGRAFNTMAERLEAQFQSLETLASIDRDILQGTAADVLIARVIQVLQARVPCLTVGLVRRESEQSPVLLEMVARAGVLQLSAHSLRLSPEQLRRFCDWSKDGVLGKAQASRLPWCLSGLEPGVERVVCLPVRSDHATEAMILIGLADSTVLEPTARRDARDLRDRVAVALATHRRDTELAYRAVHDALTGLLNRVGLHERLDALLAAPADPGAVACMPAVLGIDLDHFKQINDSLGHEAGDDLLRQASERIQGCAPPDALVARLGGDEFVIVLNDVPAERAAHACDIAQQICTRLSLPFRLRGQDRVLGASVGIALAAAHGRGREELMRHADIAMYEAKRTGRNRYAMFEQPLDNLVLERNELLAEMRDAVARREFVLHFQPRIGTSTGRTVSAEALVRWNHPRRGLLMPGRFIELAEESDLIELIGATVLDQACAQMAAWQREGVKLERISVNVSPRQLQSGKLLQTVRAALTRHHVPAAALELEVTESLLVGDAREAHAQLTELRRWGVVIALDDFGTGYSSMATLHQLPIDVMKVDRAFVKNLGQDGSSLAITRAIVALAQSLGLHTVAEGMENEAQAAMVSELGIHEMQGFYFSRPVTAEALAAFIGRGPVKVPAGPSRPGAETPLPVPRAAAPRDLGQELKLSLYDSVLSDFHP
jgi:diguanylate cyclase